MRWQNSFLFRVEHRIIGEGLSECLGPDPPLEVPAKLWFAAIPLISAACYLVAQYKPFAREPCPLLVPMQPPVHLDVAIATSKCTGVVGRREVELIVNLAVGQLGRSQPPPQIGE